MDRAVVLSLLQQPLPYAMLVFDAAGEWLAGNQLAEEFYQGELPRAMRPRLELARAQLRSNPQRVVRWQQLGSGGEFDCTAVAVHGAAGFAGLTLSLQPRADEAQRERADRERARVAHEVAEDDLWDWDIDAQIVRFSERWRRILGLRAGQLQMTAQAYAERMHPEDIGAAEQALNLHFEGRSADYRAEYRLRHESGHWLWVLGRGRVVSWSPEGKPLRMLGAHVDLTEHRGLELQLRDREALLNEAERIGHSGVWAWDPVQQALWCSEGFRRILGLSDEHPLGDPDALLDVFGREARDDLRKALIALRVGGQPYHLEFNLTRPDGSRRRLVAHGETLRDRHGHVERLLGVVQDVTHRVAREESERIRNEMLDRVAQVGRIGGWEFNLLDQSLRWTEENYRIHGIPVGTPVSVESTRHMYTGHSREIFDNAVQRMLAGERDEDTIEVQFITPEDERVWLRITGKLERRDGKPFRITGLTRDITAEREAGERIEQLAHYDTLTGLPNRFQFRELAASAIQAAKRSGGVLALLFIDLDRFKYVNDTLGHEAGDQLLLDIAGRLRAAVRSGDIVARQSGDEFLVLLRDLGRVEYAGLVARKIIESVGQPVTLGETDVNVGASIGIAVLNDANPTLEHLLRAADTAMYAAKEGGRNSYQFYSDAFYERIQRKLTLEQELRQALTRKELSLAFQPTINLLDGRIRGIETLLRWTGANGEVRSPAEFIPIAEDSGEIVPIGRWVLRQACRQARAWDKQGLKFERIAVNVSAIQLRDAEFAAQVIEACEATDWPTERLELELTESALMRDSEVLRRAFALFETHGVSLSVDDFGTGFSNLHYLHRFPVKHLKIDRSFVMHLLDDRQIERLSEAIVGLGHALRLKVVAEGVETIELADRLRSLNCDEAQGFYYTRPLAADALFDWAEQLGCVERPPPEPLPLY